METTPADSGTFRLLFVCTGNTCRSPMAEVIARHLAGELGWEHVSVRSAGVAAFDGSPASSGAVHAAEANGLDLSAHRSRLLTPTEAREADLILTMTPDHLMRVVELGAGDRASLLTSYAGVAAFDGSPASSGAVHAAEANGLDLSAHRSRLLTPTEAREADLILTMTPDHLMRVVELGAGDRASLLTSYAGGSLYGRFSPSIPDPIGGTDEEYEETFRLLRELIERVLDRLEPVLAK